MFSAKQRARKKASSLTSSRSAARSIFPQERTAEGAPPHNDALQTRIGEIPILPPDSDLEAQANRAATRSGSTVTENVGPALAPRRSLRQQSSASSLPSLAPLIKGPGQKLDAQQRVIFEPQFGYDFGQVRLHTDSSAAASARALRASAFTFGSDVVFASGAYAPHTSRGRQLLAHELAHVVQQGTLSISGIQRQGAPDAGVDASAAPVFDPDANETAARTAKPDLPQIDRKKKAEENEAAAKAVVLEAFGGEDGLNRAFEQLSPIVIQMVDQYGKSNRTANRIQFLVRMRLYFNSWGEVLKHFSNFVRVNRGPVDVWLHADAAARLNRALDVLEKKKHPFPSIGEGFSLRDRHEGKIQTAGYMTHALGYAFDIQATKNPKIGHTPSGAGGRVPDQLSTAVAAGTMSMDMKSSTWPTIEAMGKSTAGNLTAAADDRDPAVQKYFKDFAERFERMRAGSHGYLGSLSDKAKDKALKLRKDYLDLLRQIAAEKKKGRKADAALLQKLEAQRPALLQQLPPLMAEWFTAIDAEIDRTFKAHPGMDKGRSPTDISKDLKTAESNLRGAEQAERKALAEKSQALSARDAAVQVKSLAEQREHRARAGADFEKAFAVNEKARQDLLKKMDALADAIGNEIDKRRELGGAQAEQQKFAAELKSSEPTKGAWAWIDSLRDLKKALSSPDLSTPSGIKAFEGLTTGNLQSIAPVENPPLLRLLEIGYFNPDDAFDLMFFEEMAHSGFLPGATWAPGSADPMHFELVEGRNRTVDPTRPQP